MRNRNGNRVLVPLALALAACLGACDGDGGGGGGTTPPPQVIVEDNLGPAFAGIKSILTAGNGSVRICWAPANDDVDGPGQIRYRVYSASASGGQNFASPDLETAPGTTCVTVQAAIGQRRFYVVRAVDTEAQEDDNTVEVSIIPISGNVFYVDASNEDPEPNGSITDPFETIQEGVAAAENAPGGAIVLVAAGMYNEQVRLQEGGTSPIAIFGGFPTFAGFGPGTTPEQLLGAHDPAGQRTMVSGTGITQFTSGGEGLVHVENNSRPTFLGGLWVQDAEEIAFSGVAADLEISCSVVRDPVSGEIDNLTQVAVRFRGESVNPLHAVVVGSDLREFQRTGVEIAGLTAYFEVSGNFIGQAQSNSSSTTGIGTSTVFGSVLEGEILFDSIMVPTGTTTRVHFEENEIFRTNEDGVFLRFSPESQGEGGSLEVLARDNLIDFIGSGSGIELLDILFFGDGGSGIVNIDRNRIISTSDSGVDIDWIDQQLVESGAQADGPTTLLVTNNWLALNDDGVADIEDMLPPPGGAASFTFENNDGSNIESTAFNVESFSPSLEGPLNGVLELTMKNNIFSETNGGAPELNMDNPPGPNGLISLLFEGNVNANPDGDTTFELEIDSVMGTNPPGMPYNQTVTIRDNLVFEPSADSSDHIELDCFTANGATNVLIADNIITAGGGIFVDHFDRVDFGVLTGNGVGTTGTATIQILRNDVFAGDGTGIEVDASVTTLTILDIAHNRIAASDETIDVSLSSGDAAIGRAHTTIFNNRVDGNDDDQLVYDDDTEPAREVTYLYAGNNTLAHGVETSGTEIDVGGTNTLLFANNFVGFGEVDSDEGFELDFFSSVPGLVEVRNNIFSFIPGNAVETNQSNPQFINNTVAFNVMGGDSETGIIKSPNGQPFVRNTIVYRNGENDLGEGVRSSYSLIGDEDPPIGFGNVTGDPIFNLSPSLFAYNVNYQLRLGSPAIDAGDPDPLWNDPDGTRNDMGAFGGPGAGFVGSFLPDDPSETDETSMPDVPLLILGVGRPLDGSGLAPFADMHAGSPLRPLGPTAPITIAFSIPIDPTTVSGIQVTANGAPVGGAFLLGSGNRVATFTPTAPVAPGAVVRVTATGVLSAAGEPLAVPFVNDFGTAPAPTPEAEAAGGPDSNGTAATAQAIVGVPATLNLAGTLFDGTDTDVYSFAGTAGERIQATVVSNRLAAPAGDKTLTLFDTDGTTILVTDTNNAGLLTTGGKDPFIDFVLPDNGTYFLAVSGGTGDYQVHWFVR